jgi:hypothetical protein
MVKTLIESFKLNEKFKLTTLIEAVFFTIIFSLGSFFSWMLNSKIKEFSNGQTPEQLRLLLASMEPDQMNVFMTQIQSYLMFFLVGAIIILVLTLILYSLSRSLIWNKLVHNKFTFNKWKKWILLSVALLIPLIMFLIVYAVVKIVLNVILVSLISDNTVLIIFNLIINYGLFLFLLIFIFLVFYSFAKNNKVWSSIGNAFGLIKIKLWKYYLFVLIVSLLINVIAYLYSLITSWGTGVVNLLLVVIFLSWARMYLVKVLK